MPKILFVCLGNICRSPLAEGIMLHLNEKHHLNWEIDSAGTAGYHVNEPPDPRTIKNAKKNGVDLSRLRARQFKAEDFRNFDRILVMDEHNLHHVLKMARNQNDKNKVQLFLDVLNPGAGMQVPDPYYGSEEGFEEVFRLLFKACSEFVKKETGKEV